MSNEILPNKKKSGYISIGKEAYIRGNDIKFVLDSNCKEAKRSVQFATKDQKFYNFVARSSKRLTTIVMLDGRVYVSGFLPKKIIERLQEQGLHFIKVGSGLFLSVNQIDSFYGFNGTIATQLRRNRRDGTNISLVRSTKQRKTTILLKNGECVSVVCTPAKIVEAIGNGLAQAEEF